MLFLGRCNQRLMIFIRNIVNVQDSVEISGGLIILTGNSNDR